MCEHRVFIIMACKIIILIFSVLYAPFLGLLVSHKIGIWLYFRKLFVAHSFPKVVLQFNHIIMYILLDKIYNISDFFFIRLYLCIPTDKTDLFKLFQISFIVWHLNKLYAYSDLEGKYTAAEYINKTAIKMEEADGWKSGSIDFGYRPFRLPLDKQSDS